MFCNTCGKPIEENQRFCNNCGASVGGSAPSGTPPGDNAPEAAPPGTPSGDNAPEAAPLGTPPGTPLGDSAPSAAAASQDVQSPGPNYKRKRRSQAVAIFLLVLTIIPMLLGWFSLSFSFSQMAIVDIRDSAYDSGFSPSFVNAIAAGVTTSTTMFGFADIVGGTHKTVKAMQYELEAMLNESGIPIGNFSDAVTILGIAAVVMLVLKYILIAAISVLLISVLLMLFDIKVSALIGQIGGAIALFGAVVFLAITLVADFYLSRGLRELGMQIYFDIKVSASIWVYATMGLAVISFVFIAIRKKVIKGK